MNNKTSIKPYLAIFLIALLLGIFICFGLISFFFIGPHEVQTTNFAPVSYTDFVTILLSVITVLLGILGIFLAVLAVFGYSVLKNAATASAAETATKTAQDTVAESFEMGGGARELILSQFTRGGPLMEEIEERISRDFYTSVMGDEMDGLEEGEVELDDIEFDDE